jgi:hypothetical protein
MVITNVAGNVRGEVKLICDLVLSGMRLAVLFGKFLNLLSCHAFALQQKAQKCSLKTLENNLEILGLSHDICIMHPINTCTCHTSGPMPGVLRHSVKLRTLPRDTSLGQRVENKRTQKNYSYLVGMMTSPTQFTM